MPCLTRAAILLQGLLLSCAAAAMTIDRQNYGFPLHNPFEATIASTPPELRPELPQDSDIEQKDYSIQLAPKRSLTLPDNFWPVTRLHYRLARQSGEAPLIFIISGTGGNYKTGKTEFLKKLFYAAGYHVVQISSPTSYDFMVSASSTATPGLSNEDAEDLYRIMQAIHKRHTNLKISSFNLTGYSLGGLNAAFVSKLDESERYFNFRRVLLLNPPVNLYTSVRNLDSLVQTQVEGIDTTTNFYNLIFDKLTRYFREKGHIDVSEAMLYDFQSSQEHLTDEQMAMLIGATFRFSSSDLAFTSDLINRRGLITPINHPISEGTSLTPFFKLALQCSFDCYMTEQLIPMWRARTGGNSLPQLIQEVSLYALEDYLKTADKIAVMHNADDLILGPGDLGFLRRTMGERLILYPLGGHCGNLNYRVNTDDMLEFFRD